MNELSTYLKEKFPDIKENTLKIIDNETIVKMYTNGELILREDKICRFIGFIVKGSVRTYHNNPNGTEQTLYFALENEWITSYHSFLTNEPSWVSIECLEDSKVILLPKTLLTQLYKETSIANYIGRLIAENLYLQEYERNKDLLTLSASQRYQKLIDTRPELLQRIKLQHIASFIGIAKESLSRIRNQKNTF